MLVRLLVRDDEAQHAAAQRLVAAAAAAEEPVLIVLGALLETEWVLRSRYKLNKASIAGAITALLESSDVEFEHLPTVEEALYVWAQTYSRRLCRLLADRPRSVPRAQSVFYVRRRCRPSAGCGVACLMREPTLRRVGSCSSGRRTPLLAATASVRAAATARTHSR